MTHRAGQEKAHRRGGACEQDRDGRTSVCNAASIMQQDMCGDFAMPNPERGRVDGGRRADGWRWKVRPGCQATRGHSPRQLHRNVIALPLHAIGCIHIHQSRRVLLQFEFVVLREAGDDQQIPGCRLAGRCPID